MKHIKMYDVLIGCSPKCIVIWNASLILEEDICLFSFLASWNTFHLSVLFLLLFLLLLLLLLPLLGLPFLLDCPLQKDTHLVI